MKIFAISDMHGNLEGLNPSGCEIVVIAGDFSKMTGFGKWHLYDQKKWITKRFFKWTSMYPNTQFVVIAGNHDLCLDKSKTSQFSDLDWNISWPENVHYLENSSVVINGLKFYGSPNIPIINFMWAYETDHDGLMKTFDSIPYGVDVLITHSPPRIPNQGVDISLQNGRGPFGSGELAESIFNKEPKMMFCGHIHSGDHSMVEFGNTKIFNVSRLDENYDIAYEPRIIEV